MCGIVGYVGNNQACEIILDGLKKLEYRGYDSAGIAVQGKKGIVLKKKKGEIKDGLEKLLGSNMITGTCGIGHTRWATHGVPSDVNSHPHKDYYDELAIVHNGIVENYAELKANLSSKYGIKFKSQTDTEVIVNLISLEYRKNGRDLEKAVMKVAKDLKGAFSIAVIAKDVPQKIVAYRKNAPLIVGAGSKFNLLASDIPALLKYTNDIYLIENDEMVVITPDEVRIVNSKGKRVARDTMKVTWSMEDAEKGGYDHFMLKEIYEQPNAVKETLMRRLDAKGKVNLDGISITKADLKKYDKVCIVACGTAYHAGLVGKYAIERIAKIPVEIDVASEFRYRDPFVDDHTLFIAISQSGETTDTLEALREAKRKGARILSVVNVVGSSVARESDDVFYTWAGPEIAVASTKAYTTQLVCMYLIALYLADKKGVISAAKYNNLVKELKAIPKKMEEVLKTAKDIEKLAKLLYNRTQMFFIGRGLDSAVAYEGSLKLKEISYINSFAIAAGELKHGTIALMEPETIVIALATQDALYDKMFSNIEEIKARYSHIVAITKEWHKDIKKKSNEVIYIPKCDDDVTPILSVVPLQLFAYYVAKENGENIDKPRNLAKSVTVE